MVKKINLLLFLFLLIILQACTTNKEVVNISVKDIPEQIEIGTFNDAGIKFVTEYSNGQIAEEEVTESIIPEEYRHYLYEEGEHSFSFLYKGIEVNFKFTMCGKSKPMTTIPTYVENGMTYINIGRYPQTVVDDNNLISILDTISTTNSLGYIQYDGEEYKKIISNVSNVFHSDYTFINGNIIKRNVTYYFKVEPIKWRVLYQNNNEYILLCEMLLDNIDYYHTHNKTRSVNGKTIYPNNYKYSNIRSWLNGYDGTTYDVEDYTNIGFYDVAFTEEEKIYINKTLVDNSPSSTSIMTNPYVCEDTNDYLYLLSYKDVIKHIYGFDASDSSSTLRQAIVSDYARAKDCEMSTTRSYYGKGSWWLRSPYYGYSGDACCVASTGYFDALSFVDSPLGPADVAVRPAMKITIE